MPTGLPQTLEELDVRGCPIERIALTFMPKNVTIIYDGDTKFFVNGKEFSGEKWNGITLQRIENSKKHIGQHA
ncbi:hypothetical protein [Candidatus Regiella insecticola]|uniref:hypothetical protein n=1 Tax=Candidatus Regiella insecticola TaxID=138073 RepID=UPI001596EDDC|nr:hypothetical protein [Candidatus Regiella insecticola]